MGKYVLHKGSKEQTFEDEVKFINAYDFAVKEEALKIDPYLDKDLSEGQYYEIFTNVWPEEKANRSLTRDRDMTVEYVDYIIRIDINDNALPAARRAVKNRKERNRYHINKAKYPARGHQITPDEFYC